MHILTKHLAFLLLSGFVFCSVNGYAAPASSPLTPVYSIGDDTKLANPKPSLIYTEVKESKIVIPNMPAYKTQDDLGECRAFSLATIMQKYTCDKWKNDISDCRNPPSDSAISYFGMMVHTNTDAKDKNAFQPNQPLKNGRNMYDIISNLSKEGNKLILNSCKPFDNVVNNFNDSGKKEKFFTYIGNLYSKNKSKTEADIADCPDCLVEINKVSGLNVDMLNLKTALAQTTYDKFLYKLFFSGCNMESFPSGFTINAYPVDAMDVTPSEIKNKVIEGLKKGKPVLFPSLCLQKNISNECISTHSIVISGYKKVCGVIDKSNCKDTFKIHNSWGEAGKNLITMVGLMLICLHKIQTPLKITIKGELFQVQ